MLRVLTGLVVAFMLSGCLVPEDDNAQTSPTPSGTESPTPTPEGPVTITAVSHDLLPRSSEFTITGTGFVGVSSLTVGGTAQTDYSVFSDTEVLVGSLDPATPLGPRDIVVTAHGGPSNAFVAEITEIGSPTFEPPVAAVGGSRELLLASFPGFDSGATTTVTIGGVAQPVISADAGTIVAGPIDASTPVGDQTLAISNGETQVAPVPLTVIELAVNEMDSATPGTDADEFVEISTGVAGVSLEGYVLVFFNGADDEASLSIDLDSGGVVTDANGLLLVGNANVNPDIVFADGDLQNGPDAVALYQGIAAFYPFNTPVTSDDLIDALVYGATGDTGLLNGLLGAMATQIDENANGSADTQSISRCDAGLLNADGTVWSVGNVTPGMANACP